MTTIPRELEAIIGTDVLARTMENLDRTINQIVISASSKNEVYRNKSELMKKKTELETAIKLKEAEAFMETVGEGKEQRGVIDNKTILLNNDANRDAYRRMASANERRELSIVMSELNAIDTDIARSNTEFQKYVELANTIRAKSMVQSSLLNYLGGC